MFKESGYTGSILEEESFGSVEKEKYPDNEKKYFIDFKRAMDLVKQAPAL